MGHSYTSRRSEAVPFEFELDEVEFVCGGGVSLLDLSELAKLADVDAASPEGAAAIADLFRGALGPEAYARFRRHCSTHNTDTDVIVEIMRDLVEHVTAGPTVRSRPSSPGPLNGTGTSGAASYSPQLPERELTAEEIAAWRAGIARAEASPG